MNFLKAMRSGILSSLAKTNLNFNRGIGCKRQTVPQYRIRHAFPFDYMRVLDFMSETYMKEEPTITNIGHNLVETGSPLLVHAMYESIASGMTLLAEDLDGCIVGAVVNADLRREAVELGVKEAERCERGPALDIVKFYAYVSMQTDLWNVYGVDNVWECAHVAVHPEHQGRGLATRLVGESWVLARDMAYRLFRMDCTSVYTAMIAESFGWKCVYSIPFRRYFDNGDFVFKCVQEPHTEMKIYVDPLTNYKDYLPPSKKKSRK